MKKPGVLIILLLLLVSAIQTVLADDAPEALRYDDDAIYLPWVGKPAQVKFTAVDGREVDLEKLRGKVVLLDFWATWCGPCRAEIPEVRAMYEKWHASGFEIIGISFDKDKDALLSLTKKERMVWPQSFESTKNQFGEKFGIHHYPSMWFVDKQGVVRYISAGEKMEEKLRKLLMEKMLPPKMVDLAKLDSALSELKLKDVAWSAAPKATIQTSLNDYPLASGQNTVLKTGEGDLWVHCISITTNTVSLSMRGRTTIFKLSLP
ncbi:MAG: resA 1 [Pedosphaera sp.]|nr:resA 1 [Pedosphaera sp.]